MPKILLIRKNDDPCCEPLPEIFSRLGYDTICVNTAGDALKHIADANAYAVFIDIDAIPDFAQLEELITAAKPYKMVVLIGSEDNPDVICRAFALGIDDYLRKPFSNCIFEARTRSIFARYNEIKHFHDTYLEVFLDMMPSMMAVTDDTQHILFANAAFCNKFNIKKEDAFDQILCDVISCQNFQYDFNKCPQYCGGCKFYEYGKEMFSTDKRIIRKIFSYTQMRDGQPHNRTIRVSMVPMLNSKRRTVIVNLEDITFERNAINELTDTICNLRKSNTTTEEEMKVSRDLANYLQQINDSLNKEKTKRQLLFDNMTSGFMLAEYKDGNLYFREGNAKLSELAKADLSKRYGNKFHEGSELYPNDFYQELQNVAHTGRSVSFTTTLTNRAMDFRVNMYVPEQNFVAAIINDITEETKILRENKERSKQLQRLNIMLDDRNSELQKAIETKNKFISLIAHDLRNPLKWFDMSEADAGLAVINSGKYGVGLEGDEVSLSLLRSTIRPDITSDMGSHDIRYLILPHAGDAIAAGVNRLAFEYNVPLTPAEPVVPEELKRVLCGTGLYLQSMKLSEDGKLLVLRLSEQDGRRGRLAFGRPVQLLNLLEDPEGTAETVAYHPFELITVGLPLTE